MSTRDVVTCVGFCFWESDLEEKFLGDDGTYRAGTVEAPDVEEFMRLVGLRAGAAVQSYDTGEDVAWLVEPAGMEGTTMREIASRLPDAEAIGEVLKGLGFEPDGPGVFALLADY